MSDFNARISAERVNLFSTERATQPSEVLISLGQSAKKANVVRDDFAVPILEIDPGIFDDFFGGRPQIVNKVVRQSIPAGTVVNAGTAIDLVMAPANQVPGLVFQGGHSVLKERTMDTVYQDFVLGNLEVSRMLSRRSSAADLSAQDVEVIRSLAEQRNVAISDRPGETPEDLFVSLQHAKTFAD